MAKRKRTIKVIDESTPIKCVYGQGIYREEVWVDTEGTVTRYNLAFINHFLCSRDNGRVLGYDNAHGFHERHSCGDVEEIDFVDYDRIKNRFTKEVSALKGKKTL